MIVGLSCVPVVAYCVWLPGDDRCIGTVTGRLHNLAIHWSTGNWCGCSNPCAMISFTMHRNG